MTPSPESSFAGWVIFVIIGGFLGGFPLLWCFVVWMLSHLGGWQRLTRYYAASDRAVMGERCGGVQGMVGGVSYRSTLTLHLSAEGFFMEVMPLFKVGHPRLFIPWTEISARTPRAVLWWKTERLSIGQPVVGTITLPAARCWRISRREVKAPFSCQREGSGLRIKQLVASSRAGNCWNMARPLRVQSMNGGRFFATTAIGANGWSCGRKWPRALDCGCMAMC